ncbi:hypothetical protein IEO21_08945 [Rhodonia placenta]|uniref:Uncharacterized protein n=1 Tax=Rhodonia placenta TaxID=104341 RepID=A0A8H7TYX7_9APHY|nr:hypothetical protein IEO21_08945 [Postia placenta]
MEPQIKKHSSRKELSYLTR